MFKPKTLEDFEQLQRAVDHLNKENVWKLRLEVKQEYSECDLYVIDETEELYYGGCLFEEAIGFLNNSLKQDTDDDAYFDCICPGKWLADFKGRSRYTEDDMKFDIYVELIRVLSDYADDNGKNIDWSDENREAFDALQYHIIDVLNKIIK